MRVIIYPIYISFSKSESKNSADLIRLYFNGTYAVLDKIIMQASITQVADVDLLMNEGYQTKMEHTVL